MKDYQYKKRRKRVLHLLYLVILLFCVHAVAFAQSEKITLNVKDVPVRKFFDKIEEQSGYRFIYRDKLMDDKWHVTYSTSGEAIETLLQKTLTPLGLQFRLSGKDILITLKPADQQVKRVDKTFSGTITDDKGEPIIGANVAVKGGKGTVTNVDGKFTVEALAGSSLSVSYVGYMPLEIKLGENPDLQLIMSEDQKMLGEVVVVGYGVQKKESIVGAIVQATSEDIKRTGNGSDLKQALSGQLPGLVTITSSGEPGGTGAGVSATNLFIRGQNTWNGGQPLILVDGVERDMSNVDVNEVATISVLKDASATAVFGVKGANGVILITTKRGQEGKTKLNFNYTTTGTMLSKLPETLDSYAALMARNEIIEREGVLNEPSWQWYRPYEIVQRYRKPQTAEYALIYPNVDWEKEMFKTMGFTHKLNLSAQGGNKAIRFFGSLAYLHEGDMFRNYDNGKGYDPNYDFNRFNFRSNVDVSLTRITNLKINLSGFFSLKNSNYANEGSSNTNDWMWKSVYGLAPDLFLPQYPDGTWGAYIAGGNNTQNPLAVLYNIGLRQARHTGLHSDFSLEQDLEFITKGLSLSASLSVDNTIRSEGGIYDNVNSVRPSEEGTNTAFTQIYPERYKGPDQDPSEYTEHYPVGSGEYDWIIRPWYLRQESIATGGWVTSLPVVRRMNYQVQLNYARRFGKHNVLGTGVFKRDEYASGNEFRHFREDWIFRAAYDYDSKYLLEANGAYNGSEKFGPGYRFDFFPSVAFGWYVSNEKFMSELKWLSRLKLRYSAGRVGDDIGGGRWLYESQFAYGGSAFLGSTTNNGSPYTIYRQTVKGNPDVRWETAVKNNLGLELGFLKNQISLTVDMFNEDRTDILMAGSAQTSPAFYGLARPTANLGRVKSKGFEMELELNKKIENLSLWSKISASHNENKIIFRDDAPLLYNHLKQAGYSIGQQRSILNTGKIYRNWDEVYASVPTETNDLQKLPGYYNLIDFNADGIIKSADDQAPIGYSEVPQNTASLLLGAGYKGFSFMMQFYGVNNANRFMSFDNFANETNILFEHVNDYWSKDNPNATSFLPRWKTQAENIGHYYLYDASYIRLNVLEFSYTFKNMSLGISNMRLFLNGNDLFFWSDVPDDRESGGINGAYPTVKRINLGIELSF
ncbi:SusC/RagA family TonB-linked outer membrane protein [Bacteroidia bacterium]|nr:SusC/RagA family TonB-linked outer membrane protein [Bacteroidia bacterium]